MRRPVSGSAGRARTSRTVSFEAPTRGWIANESLANAKAGGAVVLDNWFPQATSVRMRAGTSIYATIAAGALSVSAMFSYSSGGTEKLFAATTTDIYDISNPPSSHATAAVTSLTSGDWIAVQFSTPGGDYLRCVNGSDTPIVYDGAAGTWSTSPAITGVTPENLSYVWSFKSRLFFVEKNSLNAWYLGIDEIGGAVTRLSLAGVFQRGGTLLFGASWSLEESGGMSASCVFVTTEGEVAVYQGINPSDAADWSLVGVYRIGKPLGKRAWTRAGGDLAIATDVGFVALSQAVSRDLAALAPAAVSNPIEKAWSDAVVSRPGDWVTEIWPAKQMAVVALPPVGGATDVMFVANANTGAWCRYTGFTGYCMAQFDGRLFVGTDDGVVLEMETGGRDFGTDTYTGVAVPSFKDMKSAASLKNISMARATFLAPQNPYERLSGQYNYAVRLPAAPDAFAAVDGSVWGTAQWGVSRWGEAADARAWQAWRSVTGTGYAISIGVQVTSGQDAPPRIDLVSIDALIEEGDVLS